LVIYLSKKLRLGFSLASAAFALLSGAGDEAEFVVSGVIRPHVDHMTGCLRISGSDHRVRKSGVKLISVIR
jgi:hypothetical protein